MTLPNFNKWIINEEGEEDAQSTPPSFSINVTGKYDKNLQELQKNLNKIFVDLPNYSKDAKYGTKLVEDGRYGDRTAQRIKDFQLLLKMAFSLEGAKYVKVDGKPSKAIFDTAKDIAEMGNQKAFSLK